MLEGFPGSLQGSRGKVLLGQRVNNHLERGFTKIYVRAVLGTRSSTGVKAVVWLGGEVGSPSPPHLPAAEGKKTVGLLFMISMMDVREVHGTCGTGWFLEQTHVHQERCG